MVIIVGVSVTSSVCTFACVWASVCRSGCSWPVVPGQSSASGVVATLPKSSVLSVEPLARTRVLSRRQNSIQRWLLWIVGPTFSDMGSGEEEDIPCERKEELGTYSLIISVKGWMTLYKKVWCFLCPHFLFLPSSSSVIFLFVLVFLSPHSHGREGESPSVFQFMLLQEGAEKERRRVKGRECMNVLDPAAICSLSTHLLLFSLQLSPLCP